MFNIKDKKIKNKDTRMTLDARHNSMINNFKKIEKSLPSLKLKFKKLADEYKKLKDIDNKNFNQRNKKSNLKKELLELRTKIKSIENKEKEVEYYLNIGSFLHNYYETKKNNKKISNNFSLYDNNIKYKEKEKTEINDNTTLSEIYNEDKKYKSVLEFFDNREKKKTTQNVQKFTNMKMSKFITTVSGFKRANLLTNYLKKVDKNYIPELEIDNNYNYCKDCKIEMTLHSNSGFRICPKCNIQERVLIESDKPSFKDPPPEVSYFAYKRMNHFNECLAQFQGKESTDVPQEVYDKLFLEIKKERIKNLAKLDYYKIRKYLKKLKLNKYYEHIPHILNRINGLPPPVLSKALEEKLRLMFKEIQNPFREICPTYRKNFLSYSYVLHKFVQLLGLDEFKNCFPLLKDREKLHQTDVMWKKICKKLDWQFIKSI